MKSGKKSLSGSCTVNPVAPNGYAHTRFERKEATPITCAPQETAYRRLAAAVVVRAVRDASADRPSSLSREEDPRQVRSDAGAFLAATADPDGWAGLLCHLARAGTLSESNFSIPKARKRAGRWPYSRKEE